MSPLILFPGPLTRSLLPSTLYWPLPIKRVDAILRPQIVEY